MYIFTRKVPKKHKESYLSKLKKWRKNEKL